MEVVYPCTIIQYRFTVNLGYLGAKNDWFSSCFYSCSISWIKKCK